MSKETSTELETQRYLRSGKTLEELTLEYAIRGKVNETLGVVMLNYNQIASPMAERICQECRALILELGTWNVVSRSFFKFFNYGEPNAHPLDWDTAQVQEKVDGSLICFYFYRGAWQIATKGTPDASGPVNSYPMTFADLVRRTLVEMGTSFAALTARLDPAVYYSFELTAPENRIIIPYDRRRLTWLAAWSADSLAELDLDTLPGLGLPRAALYPLQTVEQVLAAVAQIEPFASEGFIVQDAAGRRVKLKSAAYLMVDRVLSTLVTPRRRVEAVLSPQFDDMLAHLPESVRDELLAIQTRLNGFRSEVLAAFAALDKTQGRRGFAAGALAYPFSPILFWLLDGVSIEDCLLRTNPDRLVEWLSLDTGDPISVLE